MLYIESYSTDPQWNLALEEYLFFHKREEIFMLWQNSRSIIVGKNQNTMAEIDYAYVQKNDIKVVRRLTGGGAVYHDLGNLNFTYIVNREGFGDYVGFTKTLRDYLETLSLHAEVSGRNDVLVGGRKISGNAQFADKGRLLHHGTILLGADMSHLRFALKPDESKIISKGIRSVQSRVANISEFIPTDVDSFRRGFGDYVKKHENVTLYTLTEEDIKETEKLCTEKYSTYAWNFGYSPRYAFHTKHRFDGGTVEVYLDIRGGVIRDAKIYGDFLADAQPLVKRLIGLSHEEGVLKEKLEGVTLGQISAEELLISLL